MTSSGEPKRSAGAISRRGLLWLTGGAVAPAYAGSWNSGAQRRVALFAAELGLTGLGARQLITRVSSVLGKDGMARHKLALMHRMQGCDYTEDDTVDMLRMWARDDFAQDRTTVVEGIQFAHTEIAMFALVDQG